MSEFVRHSVRYKSNSSNGEDESHNDDGNNAGGGHEALSSVRRSRSRRRHPLFHDNGEEDDDDDDDDDDDADINSDNDDNEEESDGNNDLFGGGTSDKDEEDEQDSDNEIDQFFDMTSRYTIARDTDADADLDAALDEEYECLLVPLMMQLRANDPKLSRLAFSIEATISMPTSATLWINLDEFCQALSKNNVVTDFSVDLPPPPALTKKQMQKQDLVAGSQTRDHPYYENFRLLGRALATLPCLECFSFEGNHGWTLSAASCIVEQLKQISKLDWQCFLPTPEIMKNEDDDDDDDSSVASACLSSSSLQKPLPSRFTEAVWLADAIRGHQFLQTIAYHLLDIRINGILIAAMTTIPNLKHVIFQGYPAYDRSNGLSIDPQEADIYSLLRHPKLESLEFIEVIISVALGEMIGHAIERNITCLTSLSFYTCSMTDEAACRIAQALRTNRTLTRFVLNQFNLKGTSTSLSHHLQASLFENNILEYLNMSGCQLQSNQLSASSKPSRWPLRPLIEVLAVNRSLKTLILPTTVWTPALGYCFCQSMSQNASLRSVSLAGSGMTDVAWRNMLPFLAKNKTLRSFCLDENDLSFNCVIEAVRMLETNETLETLSISSLHATSPTLVECVSLLRNNHTIKCLRIAQCSMEFLTSVQLKKMQDAIVDNFVLEELPDLYQVELMLDCDALEMIRCILDLNKAGRRYITDDPTARDKGVQVLAAVTNSLGRLYFHLRENPFLCQLTRYYPNLPPSNSDHKSEHCDVKDEEQRQSELFGLQQACEDGMVQQRGEKQADGQQRNSAGKRKFSSLAEKS